MQTRVGLAPLALAFWALRRACPPPRGSGQHWLVRQTLGPPHCWPWTLPRERAAGPAGRWEEEGVRWGADASRRGEPGFADRIATCETLCILCVRTEGSSELCRGCRWRGTPSPALPTDPETLLLRVSFQGQSPSFWSPLGTGQNSGAERHPMQESGTSGSTGCRSVSTSARAPRGPQATAALRSLLCALSSSLAPCPQRHLSLRGDHHGIPGSQS